MARAYSDIARVLDEARRRQGWIIIGASLCRGCAVGLGVLLLGVFLLGAGIGPAAAIRQCSFGLAALASLAALALAGQTLVRRIGTRAAMARSVGWAVPELASDLISSVELHEEYPELERSGRYSLALVDAHIARTAERALGLRLARVVPAVSLRRAALFLSAAVAANLLALVAAPSSVLAGWRRLVGSAAPAPEKPPEPITGDIEITYFYPAYMKREPKTLSGTGGEVSAPKGTEVALATRADRRTESAEIAIEWSGVPAPGGATRESAESGGKGKAVRRKICPVQVTNGRELSARFVVEGGGAYRFRFRRGSRLVAEGPPLPIAVEPDAFPEIRVTAPAPEIEVGARARVRVEWTASDDVGLGELTLLTKAPSAEERRTPLRSFGGIRHESGGHEIDLAPLRLAEGERLLYWLEVSDNDAISGPKRSASATQVIKVYSEAEHHRAALKRAQVIWEELVRLLGDRLPFFDGKPGWTAERLEKAQVLDGRLRALHEGMRAGALELRQARAAPRPLSSALENIAARLKAHEQELSSIRGALVRFMRFEQPDETTLAAHVAELDAELDRELERDVLYLEQLFDKQRADDLVQAARDLAARRRDLADLLEKYRRAPTEQRKRELVAEVDRLKARMQEMMRRMGELAKGMSDEHMNEEALAEMARSNDAVTGLEQVEEMLSRGDLEGATKALDQLGNTMQQMLSALEKTAGQPGERNEGLLKEMRSFKRELEEVEGRQKEVARETEDVNGEYRRKVAEKMKQLEAKARDLAGLIGEARGEIAKAGKGVTLRSEDDFAQARDRLADLEKAIEARDFDAALETARRALPPMQRLAAGLGDDAAIAEHYRMLQSRDPRELREAQRHALGALSPAREVKDALEQMFPDPRGVLGRTDQERLGELAQKQGELEKKAGELRQRLGELAKRAPVFPPRASEMLSGSQGHMLRAQGELAQRNPQRGHGEQRQALDELARFKRGLDEMAKNAQRGGGGGFPFPFSEEEGGRQGEVGEPSQEKVEIPGAEAYRGADEFRRELLDAMRQGAPESYKGEVQRYYEELVK